MNSNRLDWSGLVGKSWILSFITFKFTSAASDFCFSRIDFAACTREREQVCHLIFSTRSHQQLRTTSFPRQSSISENHHVSLVKFELVDYQYMWLTFTVQFFFFSKSHFPINSKELQSTIGWQHELCFELCKVLKWSEEIGVRVILRIRSLCA